TKTRKRASFQIPVDCELTAISRTSSQPPRPSRHPARSRAQSFWIRIGKARTGLATLSAPRQPDRITERARRIPHLLLEFAVVIERAVRGGIWLHVADIAVELGEAARRDQLHVGQPVGQGPAHALGADGIAVNDEAEMTAGEMARIRPALQFHRLGF